MSQRSLRVAWFSSGESGSRSAYLTTQLLPYLSQTHSIEVYTSTVGEFAAAGVEAYAHEQAIESHQDWPFDLFVYNFEDAAKSEFVRRYAVRYPGIVLFHDVLFAPKHAEGRGMFPSGIAESAGCAVFFCERNTGEFLRRYSTEVRAVAPHCYTLGYPVVQNEGLHSLQSSKDKKAIAFCGSARLEHRAHLLLAAMQAMEEKCTLQWMLIDEEREEATKLLAEFPGVAVVFHTQRTPALWQSLISECRLAVLTWVSAFGDPGPYLEICLMAGCPAIVSDFSSTAMYPNNAVWKVLPGVHEEQELARICALLIGDSAEQIRDEAQEAAKAYAYEHYNAPNVAYEISLLMDRASSGRW